MKQKEIQQEAKTTTQHHSGSHTSFSELAQHAIWGAQINPGKQIVATHQEIAMLRQCAEQAAGKPNRIVHVFASIHPTRVSYLVKTLMHLGVSCGNILVNAVSSTDSDPDGVWLFVENVTQAA